MPKVRLKIFLRFVMLAALLMCSGRVSAFSFDLDSIAAMGKFPRFCVNTYRWGDTFFNGYDTLYVMPTQHKFNVKFRNTTLFNNYSFKFSDGQSLDLNTEASTNIGLWLTYMAVSVGYDYNVGKLFGEGDTDHRHRFSFQFNCMLFGAELYWERSDLSAHVLYSTIEDPGVKLPDKYGIQTNSWGADLYYFFNHKHYSQAAAYNYGRIQVRSSGSFYAGLAFWGQDNIFDFSAMPPDVLENLPEYTNGHYRAKNRNYTVKFGYGYNFVLGRMFTIGLSDAPCVGLRAGFVNTDKYSYGMALYNRAKMSFVFNRNPWFAGLVGNINTAILRNRQHSLFSTTFDVELSVGYRFNLW